MRVRSTVVALGLVGALAVGLGPAQADDTVDRKKQVDASVKALRDELEETSRALVVADRTLKAARAEIPGAEAAVAQARGKLAVARAKDAELATRLSAAEADESRTRAALGVVQDDMTETRRRVGRIARIAYQGANVSELAVALESESPDEFADRIVLTRSALRSQNGVLGQLAEARAQVAAQTATLKAKREKIEGLKAAAEKQLAATKLLDAKATAARARVQELADAAAGAKAVVEREKAAELARIATAKAESQRLNQILVKRAAEARAAEARAAAARAAAARAAAAKALAQKAKRLQAGRNAAAAEAAADAAADAAARASRSASGAGASSSRSPGGSSLPQSGDESDGSGALARPVAAGVSSAYGMRLHPITGIYRLHDGTDFAAPCGSPVRAAESGIVVWTQLMSGYGNQLAIDHGTVRGHQLSTSYSHLKSFAVSEGAQVSRGQVIGYSGGGAGMYGAGTSTGCHLHFIVMDQAAPVNGNGFATVNPMNWL